MLARLCRAYADAWHADRYAAPAELDDPAFVPDDVAARIRRWAAFHDPGHGFAVDHLHTPDDELSAVYHHAAGAKHFIHYHHHADHDDPPGAV